MSNSVSGRLWVADTVGILSNSAVCLQRIVFRPAAASQIMQLNSYQGSGQTVAANDSGGTGTITSTTTLTTTGLLPATITVGDVFHILASTGNSANIGKQLVTTAGDTNAVVCSQAGWTNEASKVYRWTTYPQRKEVYLTGGASDASAVTLDWGPNGRWFNNLILQTIGGGAVDLYLK
jgi:hypothetical protein